MGYTHYWRGLSKTNPETYQGALQDIRKVIAAAGEMVGEQAHGDSVDGPPVLENGKDICINGRGGNEFSHETFCLPTDPLAGLKENEAMGLGHQGDFDFCKTARKPYDLVVTASLAVLAQFCPEVKVSSDGGPEDWKAGVIFAHTVLDRLVPCPVSE